MFDIDMVEHDLLEMKAGTLYKYGKKVELAEKMYEEKVRIKTRTDKILERLNNETVIKNGWFRKKRQQELTVRVSNKLKRLERDIKKLAELKEKYLEEFKLQREFCGMNDHSFIDKFYKK
jgi:hypothetical protein